MTTCGSGRLLLAYHVRNLGNYLVAEDISRTCCLMTVCNMLMHGCVGEVIQHDSLLPEDFKDGWFVNPVLTTTGIPTIRKMSEDELPGKPEHPPFRPETAYGTIPQAEDRPRHPVPHV